MSLGNDMPDDPGAPANTDPEGASPNEAEAAVDEARLAQETPDGDAPEGAVDGENVAEELDDIDAEVDGLQDDPDVAVESAEDDAARDLQSCGQLWRSALRDGQHPADRDGDRREDVLGLAHHEIDRDGGTTSHRHVRLAQLLVPDAPGDHHV